MDLIQRQGEDRTPPLNLLKSNRDYAYVGSTAVITAEPAVVHFGGFQPGQVLQQVVHIINTAPTATRVHVIPPDTTQFTVTHKRKAGSIAPGLSEQLLVQFSSRQLQYHYDCIRVHTEAGGLLIPLHAYPIMNTIRLPKQVDFGKVAIGETASKQLQLSCKVPLEFAFQVRVLKQNKCFTVTPLAGTVPANGSFSITVAFTPASMTTEEAQIQVLLSELVPQLMVVTITGSAMPGVARDRLLAAQTAALSNSKQGQQHAQSKLPVRSSVLTRPQHTQPTQLDSNKQQSTLSGLQTNTLLPVTSRHKKHHTQQLLVDGIYFPVSLATQHDVNSVINQQPGRLRMKDVKGAIADRKLEMQQEQQQLDAVLAAGTASGVDPFDQPDIPATIKEALFQMQLKQSELAAKHNTGVVGSQSSPLLGQEPPSPDTIRQLHAARQAVLDQYQQNKQEAASHRLQLDLQQSGALHVLDQQQLSVSGVDQPVAGQVPEADAYSSSSSSSMHSYPGLAGFRPRWLLLESNEWRKRVQVAQRFVHAVRVVMYRNRAQARLQKLKLLSARLQGNQDAMAGAAMHEVLLEDKVIQRPGRDPAELLQPSRIRLAELPVYRSQRLSEHPMVPQGTYGDFTMLQQQPYKAEFEWKLLGYTSEDYPGLIPYLPPCKDQPLMTGAGEELPSGLPCGVLPASLDEADIEAMPESVMSNPYSKLEIGDRYTNSQVFVAVSPAWGMQADTLLQPKMYEYYNSVAQEQPGIGGVRALAKAPPSAPISYCRLQATASQVGPAGRPQLLHGPDPADSASGVENGHGTPGVLVRVPATQLRVTSRQTGSDEASRELEVASVTQQRALDDVKRQNSDVAVQGLVDRTKAYNATLPGTYCLAVGH